MNAELEHDLTAWQAGEISRVELLTRHGADAAELSALHDHVLRVAAAPIPDAEASWGRILNRLDEPAPVVRLGSRLSHVEVRPG